MRICVSKHPFPSLPRHGSGGGLFARRLDFSSFNALPRHKINSYHIKVGSKLSVYGITFETREKIEVVVLFVLSSLVTVGFVIRVFLLLDANNVNYD